MIDATQPRMARGTKLVAAFLAAAVFALLAFAPFASAESDPVGSGSTRLYLKKGFEKKLNHLDVFVQKWGSGSFNGKRIEVAVEGGSVDPLTGEGKVTNKANAGFKFKHGKRAVPISEIEVNTRKNWVRAKIANATMQLGWLVKSSYGRDGFGAYLQSQKLQLTGKAARRISNKLGMKNALEGGRVISNSYTTEQPSEATLVPTGSATLNLSPAAAKKLGHVGTPPFPEGFSPVAVALSEVPPTSLAGLDASFPISGGRLAPAANAGTLQTAGGLKLVQNLEAVSKKPGDVTTLTMGNIWVDLATLQASVEVTIANPVTPEANLGNLGRASIGDISLAGATIVSDPATRTISIQNASATLQAVTAETLNQVFIDGLEKASEAFKGQEKFAAGDPLGTFSFTAIAQ
jgi:hypothetical protein